MWLKLLVFQVLTSEEICRTQMMAGSLRSRWQFSKSAHSSILKRKCTIHLKWKFLQAIRVADVKAITACRTLTLEARDLVDLLRVVGFPPENINHTLIALSLPVPLFSSPQPGASSCSILLSCSNSRSCFYSLFAEAPWSEEKNNPVDWKKK
jgi:hypothetical protein